MSNKPFFTDGLATDISYRNVRAAENEFLQKARKNCEALWEIYKRYADEQFLTEIRSNFDARYWEMYLTTFLISLGYEVSCPKPGPDVGIKVDGLRIWFEATCPSRGADNHADQVPAVKFAPMGEKPEFHEVPNERMILRYLNSISEKYEEQYHSWLDRKIVGQDDAFVIAINPRRLQHELGDTQPPRILQAAFPLGKPYAVIDSKQMKQVDAGYHFRDAIKKASGAAVTTGVFLREDYAGLSGLLCSRIDAVNQPIQMGHDFQVVPNPNARVRLPEKFRLKGTYFRVERAGDNYSITPENNP